MDSGNEAVIRGSEEDPLHSSGERKPKFVITTGTLILGVIVAVLFASIIIVTVGITLLMINSSDKQEREEVTTKPLYPMIINTWPFIDATSAGWDILRNNGSGLDAVEAANNICEEDPEACGFSVGFGGSPDTNGESTLDAMIMHAPTRQVGAVASLRRVKKATSVARQVMEQTEQTLLVGEDATSFALYVGFLEESLTTNRSRLMYQNWEAAGRVPNYWKEQPHNWNKTLNSNDDNIYNQQEEDYEVSEQKIRRRVNENNHDTIGVVVIDEKGDISCGCSTNGLTWKIPGRVGDGSLPGNGAYCDNEVGGAAQTGDGDVMMRFTLTRMTVWYMKMGRSPTEAAKEAINEMVRFYPKVSAAIVAVNKKGEVGAATVGFGEFQYSYVNPRVENVTVVDVEPYL